MADAKRPTPAQRGYNTQWQTTRDRYLDTHPQCQWPGCDQPATQVDHIDGQGPLAPNGHDPVNLQALCAPHHSHKTVTQDGGFGRVG